MAKNVSSKNGHGSPKSGRYVKKTAASALVQAPVRRDGRTESSRSSRTRTSADALAQRAWKTTYRNRASD